MKRSVRDEQRVVVAPRLPSGPPKPMGGRPPVSDRAGLTRISCLTRLPTLRRRTIAVATLQERFVLGALAATAQRAGSDL